MLEELLPHRPPFLMLDALREAGPERGVGVCSFPEGSCGCGPRGPLPEALIEAAAQTMAALMGQAALQAGTVPGRGLLVGVKGFRFLRQALCAVELQIELAVERRLGPLCLAQADILQQGERVASGKLKFYVEDVPA